MVIQLSATAGSGKTSQIMGVELRMTDKKRIGGSCDFLLLS